MKFSVTYFKLNNKSFSFLSVVNKMFFLLSFKENVVRVIFSKFEFILAVIILATFLWHHLLKQLKTYLCSKGIPTISPHHPLAFSVVLDLFSVPGY